MYDDEKESKYLTILEMLDQMSMGKAIAVILGFYTLVGSVATLFIYLLTRHR